MRGEGLAQPAREVADEEGLPRPRSRGTSSPAASRRPTSSCGRAARPAAAAAGRARATGWPGARARPGMASSSRFRTPAPTRSSIRSTNSSYRASAAHGVEGDGAGLVVVVGEDQRRPPPRSSPRGCGCAPRGSSTTPFFTRRFSRILMFTSWSDMSTPPELSTASVLSSPPVSAVLEPAALGEAQVAALADHPRPHLVAVDPHAVVGAVAHLRRPPRRRPSRRCRCRRCRAGRRCAVRMRRMTSSPDALSACEVEELPHLRGRAGWPWPSGRRCRRPC